MLDLHYTTIDNVSVAALAAALATNTAPKKLVLGINRIGNEGTTAIATALAVNTTLGALILSNNDIGAMEATALATELVAKHGVDCAWAGQQPRWRRGGDGAGNGVADKQGADGALDGKQ